MTASSKRKTTLLCILDGWGLSEEKENNAIAKSDTPNWDGLLKNYPNSQLMASEKYVGLPEGQMGNSEVGHLNIGAGRVMLQTLPRVNEVIKTNKLAEDSQLLNFIDNLKKSGGVCHLLGLVSDGGVHAHIDHVVYLANVLDSHNVKTHIHAILDGRDTAPESALKYIRELQNRVAKNVQISSITGRYYAMDRNNSWDRTKLTYEALAQAKAPRSSDFLAEIEQNYKNKKTDEFIKPIISDDYPGMNERDGFLMANFRADRARQIINAFLDDDFKEFKREKINFACQLGMVEYSKKINEFLPCLFPSHIPENTLSEIIEKNGLKQLHIAETEKYAHVTFFFAGGIEEPQKNETRILIPSPDVKTYDLQPEMSALKVKDELVSAIKNNEYDFIVVNFANPDMVGHTGVWEAAKTAVEKIDIIIGELEKAIIESDSQMLVTADHGNIEQMFNAEKGSSHTAHTLNPVPCVIVKNNANFSVVNGSLCDLAPTILELMKIKKPSQMSGKSLIL